MYCLPGEWEQNPRNSNTFDQKCCFSSRIFRSLGLQVENSAIYCLTTVNERMVRKRFKQYLQIKYSIFMEILISGLQVENSAIYCLTTVLELERLERVLEFNIHGNLHIAIGGLKFLNSLFDHHKRNLKSQVSINFFRTDYCFVIKVLWRGGRGGQQTFYII